MELDIICFSGYIRIYTTSLAYLIEEDVMLQCLVAQSNKLINILVKGIREKPSSSPITKGDDAVMEEEGDEEETIDENKVKLYSQGCEVCAMLLAIRVILFMCVLAGYLVGATVNL